MEYYSPLSVHYEPKQIISNFQLLHDYCTLNFVFIFERKVDFLDKIYPYSYSKISSIDRISLAKEETNMSSPQQIKKDSTIAYIIFFCYKSLTRWNIGNSSRKMENKHVSNTSWQTFYKVVTGGRDDVSS